MAGYTFTRTPEEMMAVRRQMAAATRKDALMDMSMPPNEFHDMMRQHSMGDAPYSAPSTYGSMPIPLNRSMQVPSKARQQGKGRNRSTKRVSKKRVNKPSSSRHKSVTKSLNKMTKKA